nr:MAG TPA: restriction alleviation protein [Caudoviricetes sp.]
MSEWISVKDRTEWRTSASRMKYCMFCGARMVNTDE